MKTKNTKNIRRIFAALILLSFGFLGNVLKVSAHGGEDHGDEKPKTATNAKGTVTRAARLGEYELTFKHPLLEPDTATAAHLFVTKFQTNEAAGEIVPAVEIEAANSSVTEAAVEKTETAGIYNVKFPALPEGAYTIRVKLTDKSATDTATFSGVEVKPQPVTDAADGAASWARTILIGFVFALVLGLFGGLIFLVWRYAGESEANVSGKETVSA